MRDRRSRITQELHAGYDQRMNKRDARGPAAAGVQSAQWASTAACC
jgi:hypothetical protein